MTRRFQFAVPFLLAVAAAGAPAGAAGQSLHLAELFADQGRFGDALAEVLAWFEIRGSEATDQEVQHGLFLRGCLVEDPADGMRDMLRILDDYPHGTFAPRALEWLADSAERSGDVERASALHMRVVRDFPDAEQAPAARSWLADHGIAVAQPPSPAAEAVDSVPVPSEEPPPSLLPARDTIPVTDSVAEQPEAAREAVARDTLPSGTVARDTVVQDTTPADSDAESPVVPPPPADTVSAAPPPSEQPAEQVEAPAQAAPEEERPAPVPHGPPVPGAAEGGAWAVQIGAFRNPVGAGGLVDEMVEAGLDARLIQVPMNDLLRVRVGRFTTQEAAEAELERVRAAGWDGVLVSDARRETIVRR